MRGFFWYPTIGMALVIPNVLVIFFLKDFRYIASVINNISLIFHYTFLSIFIYKVIPSSKKDIIFKVFFAIFFCLIILCLAIKNIDKNNGLAFAIANFALVCFCLKYYSELFNNIPTFNLLREPSFWILSGIFFSMSLHIPVLMAKAYFPVNFLNEKFPILYNITLFCYGIMHLFFIKAYLCAIHPQKT